MHKATGGMREQVSFIAGAGRGRTHAVRQAGEGADITTGDICADIESDPCPMAGWETRPGPENSSSRKAGVAAEADVRDREQPATALDEQDSA